MAPLNPDDARIFRITHRDNVPWLLANGLHCPNSDTCDPNFIPIGLPDLIQRRRHRVVPIPPGGTLDDYVPFYFTPRSVMLYNIKTGCGGVIERANNEIVILVSSLPGLAQHQIPFVFTNSHAYMNEADFFGDLEDLRHIDWPLLRSRDFRRDPDDPGKLGRYQAEALAHRHVPVEALLGIACYDVSAEQAVSDAVAASGLTLQVKAVPHWYF